MWASLKKRFRNTGWRLFLGLVLVGAAVLDILSFWQPWKTEEPIVWEMNVCSVDGRTISLAMDGALVDNGIDPVHYDGTLRLGPRRYVDPMTYTRIRYLRFSAVDRLLSVPKRLYARWRGISHTDFSTISFHTLLRDNRVNLTVFCDADGKQYVQVEERRWDHVESTVYYGPADTSDSAQTVREKLSGQ